MKRSGLCAWRFVHPDLEAGIEQAPRPSGLQIRQGGIDLVEGDQAVRQSILLLLSTRPGERLMHPEYGCHLHRLVFAPNNHATAGIAVYYVRRALQQWEPRIDILRLDASRDPQNPNQLMITLEYRVRITQSRETLELSLDLEGG